jgi:hypothetical protein
MKKPLIIWGIVVFGLLTIFAATRYVDLAALIMRIHGR